MMHLSNSFCCSFLYFNESKSNSLVIMHFNSRLGIRLGFAFLLSLCTYNLAAVNITNAQVSSAHIGEDLIIQNGGTLTTDGTHSVNSIEVQVGGKLDVTAGHPLTVATNLLFDADATTGTYSSRLNDVVTLTSGAGSAKYVKSMDDTQWFFMSFPYDVSVASITLSAGLSVLDTDLFIREYDGNNRSNSGPNPANWVHITSGTLTAKKGYIFGLKNGHAPCDVTFPFNVASLANESVAKTVQVYGYASGTAGSLNLGWNLIGVPYLSKFDESGMTDFNFLSAFNGSTYDQVATADAAVLNPMTAYFVQVAADNAAAFAVGQRSLVQASVQDVQSDRIRIYMTTALGSDNTNLYVDPTYTSSYQIGVDLTKIITTGTAKPQIYSSLGGVNYAYNAIPIESANNLALCVYNNIEDSATIRAEMTSAPGISHLFLTDNTTGITTDLASSNYRYKTVVGTETGRFLITAQSIATSSKTVPIDNKPILNVQDHKLIVSNISANTSIRILDPIGHVITTKNTTNKLVEIPLKSKGIYLVQLKVGTESWAEKIVNY